MDTLPRSADVSPMFNPESLRVRRAAADLTQADLAAKIGVSQSVYARWERPDEPDEAQLRALSKALGCKVDDLCRDVQVR